MTDRSNVPKRTSTGGNWWPEVASAAAGGLFIVVFPHLQAGRWADRLPEVDIGQILFLLPGCALLPVFAAIRVKLDREQQRCVLLQKALCLLVAWLAAAVVVMAMPPMPPLLDDKLLFVESLGLQLIPLYLMLKTADSLYAWGWCLLDTYRLQFFKRQNVCLDLESTSTVRGRRWHWLAFAFAAWALHYPLPLLPLLWAH